MPDNSTVVAGLDLPTKRLLKLAEECEEYSKSYINLENAPQGCALLQQSATALREAHEKIEYNVTKRLEMQDELTKLHETTQQLRAELERAKEDTSRIDNLERVIKNSCFEKVSLQTNGSGYITISRPGRKHADMKALHHGPYYDLREALTALKEGE